jgi:hypothetical protein
MALSQNGWSANDRSVITTIPVPGGTLPVREGAVAVVFEWLARRFNDDVEPLHWPGCWGYAERPIRGSTTTLSNHASGTAVDFNAPKHPLGKVGTYTSSQVRAIRRILTDAHGVIRWGGDYTGRRDEMHFEVNASAAAVAALARTLQEDEMPLTDADVDKIAHRVWAYNQDGKKRQAWAYIQAAAADQTPAIAAAVKAQLPVTGSPTQAQLEQALRTVLGSLDE